jgi:prepilin-type N-terminal cleavage/methylation domain-containing protein/prepilin-type processing-associated H-X9-DG protein
MRRKKAAFKLKEFTLVELLVVIAILSILSGLLLPALSRSKGKAKAMACANNLKSLGIAMLLYQTDNKDCVVPSYNMTGTSTGIIDGWAPILDRDNYIKTTSENSGLSGNVFACPEMLDINGRSTAANGGTADGAATASKGYMDWPYNSSTKLGTTIPGQDFNKIIRVGYWISADNPTGSTLPVYPNILYTCSVGYGPGAAAETSHGGQVSSANAIMVANRAMFFKRPSNLIAVADGFYTGRNRDCRKGQANLRIGYRHPGGVGSANVLFGDGHTGPIEGDKFPRAGLSISEVSAIGLTLLQTENSGGNDTAYCDPEKFLGTP